MSDYDIDDAFAVVCRELPAAGIRFLMVGGHAVNYYGYSRATQDVDFMIAAYDVDGVRRIMMSAGFTNVADHDVAVFFNKPGSPLRIDFLRVDEGTMDKLLANAVEVVYFGDHRVAIPRLRDLIAMKLFALRGGNVKRKDKDFPDIVNLVLEHDWDVASELKPLCDEYGDADTFFALAARIEELRRV